MPALIDQTDDQESSPLGIKLDLINLETYSNARSEGWLNYSLSFFAGDAVIVQVAGTIHDTDARELEKMLSGSKKMKFQPLEPDFSISLEEGEADGLVISGFVDYGLVGLTKMYTDSGLGVKFAIDNLQLKKFAQELAAARIKLTEDKRYKL